MREGAEDAVGERPERGKEKPVFKKVLNSEDGTEKSVEREKAKPHL